VLFECHNDDDDEDALLSVMLRCDVVVRSGGDVNDDKLMNLPSFLEAFSSIITQLSKVHISCTATFFSPNFIYMYIIRFMV